MGWYVRASARTYQQNNWPLWLIRSRLLHFAIQKLSFFTILSGRGLFRFARRRLGVRLYLDLPLFSFLLWGRHDDLQYSIAKRRFRLSWICLFRQRNAPVKVSKLAFTEVHPTFVPVTLHLTFSLDNELIVLHFNSDVTRR